MKKIIALLLALVLLLTLAACDSGGGGGGGDDAEDYAKDAQALIDEGDIEGAIALLEEGIEETDDEALKEMLAGLQGAGPAVCPECEAELAEGAKFCPDCGAAAPEPAPVTPTNCPECEAELSDGAKFCPECGASTDVPVRPEGVPEDAIELNGHYYYLYDSSCANTYTKAWEYCRDQGGYLSVISSEEENEFLYDYLTAQGFDSAYFAYSKAGNTWVWDSSEASTFSNLTPDAKNSPFPDMKYAMLHSGGTTWKAGNGTICENEVVSVAVSSVSASSYLVEPDVDNVPERAIDNDISKPWVEGSDDVGIGESITFNFPEQTLSSFFIYAGYQDDIDVYEANARPKEISMTLSDGTVHYFTLSDIRSIQELSFPEPVQTSSVTLTILSVYPGLWWKDTPISEMGFYGFTGRIGFLCEWSDES